MVAEMFGDGGPGTVIVPDWMRHRLIPALDVGNRPPLTDPMRALDELNDYIRHCAMATWKQAVLSFVEQYMEPRFVKAGLWQDGELGPYRQLILTFADLLALCRPYLWRHEPYALAEDLSRRLDGGTTWHAGMLHSPAMYWASEEDALVREEGVGRVLLDAGMSRLLATVVIDRQHVYRRFAHRDPAATEIAAKDTNGLIAFSLWATSAGIMVPTAASSDYGEAVVPEARLLAARCLFLGSKLAALSGGAAPRPARKRWERAHPALPVPTVDVVTLRRREVRERSGEEGGAIEYSCQWPVRAHPHRYYHKSLKEWRTHIVGDYIKGPPGAPLRIPARKGTVYKVDR